MGVVNVKLVLLVVFAGLLGAGLAVSCANHLASLDWNPEPP